ncbi:MAG: DUF5518 domain-containing protein [Methanobacterium sp.]|nr:DUF5518 domain-containing protein [Methanobacterium sp.]
MFCPECGHKNDSDSNFCDECGYKLNNTAEIIIKQKVQNEDFDQNKPEFKSKLILEAVLVGIISAIILLYITQGNIISFILVPLICSILASFLFGNKKNYGSINGISIGLIAVFSAFFFNHDSSTFLSNTGVIGPFLGPLSVAWAFILIIFFLIAAVIGIPLGIIGGKIGIYLNKSRSHENKTNITTYIKSFNWKAILIGSILGSVVGIIILLKSISYLGVSPLPLLIGLITGYIADGSWKKGAIHGGIASSIVSLVIMIIFLILIITGSSSSVTPDAYILTLTSILLSIIGIVILICFLFIGALGGIIGSYIKKLIKNRQSNN